MITLHEMKKEDIKKVLEIYNEALIEGKSTFNNVCPSVEDWDNSHLKTNRLVAKENGEIIAFSALSPTSSRACYKGVCEISIYITKNARGAGLGTLLLKESIKKAEENLIYSLYASIFSSNIASIKICTKNGFRIVGTREKIAKDIFNNWQDTTIVEYRSRTIGID